MTTVSVVGNSVKLSNAAGTISLLPRGADYSIVRKDGGSVYEFKLPSGVKVGELDIAASNLTGDDASRLAQLEGFLNGTATSPDVVEFAAFIEFNDPNSIDVVQNEFGVTPTMVFDDETGLHQLIFGDMVLSNEDTVVHVTSKVGSTAFIAAGMNGTNEVQISVQDGGEGGFVFQGYISIKHKL